MNKSLGKWRRIFTGSLCGLIVGINFSQTQIPLRTPRGLLRIVRDLKLGRVIDASGALTVRFVLFSFVFMRGIV